VSKINYFVSAYQTASCSLNSMLWKGMVIMEFVIELLFEIILDGCIILTEERKVPLIIRIICAIILILIACGLIGILLFLSIQRESIILFLVTCIVAVIYVLAFVYNYRKIKNNNTFSDYQNK